MIPDYMFLTQEASNIALYNIGYDLEIRFTNDFLVNLTLNGLIISACFTLKDPGYEKVYVDTINLLFVLCLVNLMSLYF